MVVAVTVKINKGQRGYLIAHDVPIALAPLHVEALEEAIPADNDVHFIWVIEGSYDNGSNPIFNLAQI